MKLWTKKAILGLFILTFVLLAPLYEYWTGLEEKMAHRWRDKSKGLEEASPMTSEGGYYTAYGTVPLERQNNWVSQKAFVKLYTVSIVSMLLLWIAQWLFWSGFIGLSLEEYVFMHILSSY